MTARDAPRVLLTAALTLAAIAALPPAIDGRQQTPQRPIFRAENDSVLLDFAVRHGDEPVTGLTMSDFEVLDNGVSQTPAQFTSEQFPLDLTLLIDRSGHSLMVLDQFKSAAAAVMAILGDEDRVRILGFSTTVQGIFDGLAVEGADALDHLESDRVSDLSDKGQSISAPPPTPPPAPVRGLPPIGLRRPDPGAGVPIVQARGTTSIYDAIVAALIRRRSPDRRALVVAFSTGVDDASTTSPDVLKDVARRADVVLDMFLAFPPADPLGGRFKNEQGEYDEHLKAAAELTGGTVEEMLGDDQVTSRLKTTLLDFKARYTLSYTIHGVPRPGWHDVTIKVKNHDDYKVLVRKGYDGGR